MNETAAWIPVTTLLVRGLKSDQMTEAGVSSFRSHSPQLKVYDVAGAGHMLAADKNDCLIKAYSNSCCITVLWGKSFHE